MSKTLDAQQTNEVRELTAAELDSVNGGRGSVLGTAAVMWGAAVDAVFEQVVPLVRGLL